MTPYLFAKDGEIKARSALHDKNTWMYFYRASLTLYKGQRVYKLSILIDCKMKMRTRGISC